jgi:2-dehydro-3-deoxyphosphogluconate aldolase/(4S)-4-hydroxy-2-oxoglutarate aldolase
MAKYSRIKVIDTILDSGLIPVFNNTDLQVSIKIIDACIEGGAKVVEFTNRTDFSHETFGLLIKHYEQTKQEIIIGTGSIMDSATAMIYINNGANFIVGPIFSEEVARSCNRRKIMYAPGCGSATEISKAEEFGVEICKIFPGDSVGGPNFIKNILGPSPWTKIMPTGGVDVDKDNVFEWIKAGAAALGAGSNLISKDDVGNGNYQNITDKVKKMISWIKEARGIK